MAFLRNTWYVAAWAQDLAPGKLLARRFLNEPVVLFRKQDSSVAALEDVCPHRYAPLSLGKIVEGNRVQCAYHGLEFDGSGRCVFNPHGAGRIPAAARTRSYATYEKHSLIWIWMGDAGAADPAAIPDFQFLDPDSGRSVSKRDWLLMDAGYELIVDNLLDLSHVSYLHDGILGSAETVQAEIKLEQKGTTVTVRRWSPDCPVPGFFDLMFKRDGGRVDMWQDIRWDQPGCLMNDVGVTDRGAPRTDGTGVFGMHFLTPETETSTWYHFAAVRQNPRSWGEPLDTEIQQRIADLRRYAFEQQDQAMIRAQQQILLRNGGKFNPVMLEIDAGPTRYRRIMDELIRQEQQQAAAE
jgi:phenylpropionate dioxygenase-like ring-hydroxylating dioxygenase large terminal subunit